LFQPDLKLFLISQGSLAHLANLGFLAFDFLLVKDFYALPIADGAETAATGWDFFKAFSSMRF
jgi:hypothetical protein